MEQIIVFDTDDRHCMELCAMLGEKRYRAIPVSSLNTMEKHLLKNNCMAVIVDIEHADVDNTTIRNLSINYPGVYFLGMSKRHYNPTLREAICYHIFVCLNKPIDPDELFYWLKSIREQVADSDIKQEE